MCLQHLGWEVEMGAGGGRWRFPVSWPVAPGWSQVECWPLGPISSSVASFYFTVSMPYLPFKAHTRAHTRAHTHTHRGELTRVHIHTYTHTVEWWVGRTAQFLCRERCLWLSCVHLQYYIIPQKNSPSFHIWLQITSSIPEAPAVLYEV